MSTQKLFRATRFSFFALFAVVVLSVSAISITTIQTQIREEYLSSSRSIVQNIADSSVDILLNRNLATLQSLIDQFAQTETVRYIYVTSDTGEYLAHTFVPGIPAEILASDPHDLSTTERNLPGLGNFIEVGSPILSGVAGTVHLGMDLELVEVKIQRAVGQQMFLFGIILVIGTLLSFWFVNFTAKPLRDLIGFARLLAGGGATGDEKILDRDDEAGDIARVMLHLKDPLAASVESASASGVEEERLSSEGPSASDGESETESGTDR